MILQRRVGERTLACWVHGKELRPERRTLLFVHGAGGDHTVWERQYTVLSEAFQIVALDLPGHGGSPGPGEEEASCYAEWVKRLIDDWGIARPVLIGHSLGAAICLHLAGRRPAAAALVMVGGGARMPVNPAFLAELAHDPAAAMALAAHYALAPRNRERLAGLLAEGFSATTQDVLCGDFLACDRLDLGDRLGRIRVPTLVVCGKEDKMTPPSLSVFLRDGIAGARLSLIEGVGHFAMQEDPEAFNRVLVPFVRSLPAEADLSAG